MSAFFRLFSASRRARHAEAQDPNGFDAGFKPGDRIGQPPRRRRSKVMRRLVLALGLSGLGTATYQDPSLWPRTWSVVEPFASSVVEAAMTAATKQSIAPAKPVEAPLTQALAPAAPEPPTEVPASTASSAEPAAIAATDTAAATPPEDTRTPAEAAKDAAITAMRAPVTDPHQKRAEAAGLHPDLSPALLKRLSDTDFKTAAIAIRKALAEIDDNSVLVWPEKPKPASAMFHVSFVPGAAQSDCRRYIVAIAKDGWQTTALPVEKCGVKRVMVRKS